MGFICGWAATGMRFARFVLLRGVEARCGMSVQNLDRCVYGSAPSRTRRRGRAWKSARLGALGVSLLQIPGEPGDPVDASPQKLFVAIVDWLHTHLRNPPQSVPGRIK